MADENRYLASFDSRGGVNERFKRGPTRTLIGLEQCAAMTRRPELPTRLPYRKKHRGVHLVFRR